MKMTSGERFCYLYFCRKGKGSMYYLSGDRYIGDWDRNMEHGKGVYQYTNGDRYRDMEQWKGVYQYTNGDRYFRDMERGGVYQYTNGDSCVQGLHK